MRVYLYDHTTRYTLAATDGVPFAIGPEPCPLCKASPWRVAGRNRRIADDDRAYEADGFCVDCGAAVGLIRAEASTLFGLHEDEAVLHGRPRVY